MPVTSVAWQMIFFFFVRVMDTQNGNAKNREPNGTQELFTIVVLIHNHVYLCVGREIFYLSYPLPIKAFEFHLNIHLMMKFI